MPKSKITDRPNNKAVKVFYKSVRVNFNIPEINNYIPSKKGIHVAFGKYDPRIGTDLHLFGSNYGSGDPTDDIDKSHINEELSRIGKRIVDDSPRIKKNPLEHHKMSVKGIMESLPYSGQNDKLNSKAVEVEYITVPKREIKTINTFYERNSKRYDRPFKPVQIIDEFKGKDGIKYCIIKVGKMVKG